MLVRLSTPRYYLFARRIPSRDHCTYLTMLAGRRVCPEDVGYVMDIDTDALTADIMVTSAAKLLLNLYDNPRIRTSFLIVAKDSVVEEDLDLPKGLSKCSIVFLITSIVRAIRLLYQPVKPPVDNYVLNTYAVNMDEVVRFRTLIVDVGLVVRSLVNDTVTRRVVIGGLDDTSTEVQLYVAPGVKAHQANLALVNLYQVVRNG